MTAIPEQVDWQQELDKIEQELENLESEDDVAS